MPPRRSVYNISGREALAWLVTLAISPIFYIIGFDALFGLSIPIGLDTWFLITVVGVIAVLATLAIVVLALLGGVRAFGGLGVILGFVALLLMPVLFILAFNLVLATSVPITLESYVLVGGVLLAVIVINTVVQRAIKGR